KPTSLSFLFSSDVTAELPNWSQFFKGQSVSLSCEDEGPGWTLRRNTSTETRTQCGTEWGRGNGSSCRIRTLFSWDSGVYWCESSEGQTRTSGPLVLHSPVLPVMEGQEVSLHCQTHPPSNRSADFYKDGVFVGVGPAGHMTIPQVSLAHQGVYRCDITGVGQSPPSWMSVSGQRSPVSSLKVSPNWSQFFEGQLVSLSCEDEGPGWTLRRNTSRGTRRHCGTEWGRGNGSSCRIRTLFSWDSGVYWCESSEGQTRTSISLSVTGGPLVLHSPVLPVMEGQEVSLHCRTRPPSNRSADFYKDGVFVGVGPAGHMTIPQVSLAHQGVYRCDITGVGQSPPSWMSVSGQDRQKQFISFLVRLIPISCCTLPGVVNNIETKHHNSPNKQDVHTLNTTTQTPKLNNSTHTTKQLQQQE
uniref:Ig-like domain-containing protein n=1 Tax=Sphaeramia orbicularis TaxID=375764 RepID=A0A673AGP7_9TELE